jgi:formylglycine-generating enzyme
MKLNFAILVSATAIFLLGVDFACADVISMAWSPVGNPGNAPDPLTGDGAVSYSYSIGTYDVTVNQYVAFLNANDPSGADPLSLYNSDMSNTTYGGVNFNPAAPQGQMYSAIAGTGNHPINYVSWIDAIRFANWMDNGQPIFVTEPTATDNATENGSYTLTGFMPDPSNDHVYPGITRNPGATIVLPSLNEWYKAAYYNPSTSSYFLYPTSSNTPPFGGGPTATPNFANNGLAVGNLTDVGAYTGTTSPYGEYDMAGNIQQWEQTPIFTLGNSFEGATIPVPYFFTGTGSEDISGGDAVTGFRLAMVPEPSSIVLAIIGCVGAFALRRRIAQPK